MANFYKLVLISNCMCQLLVHQGDAWALGMKICINEVFPRNTDGKHLKPATREVEEGEAGVSGAVALVGGRPMLVMGRKV